MPEVKTKCKTCGVELDTGIWIEDVTELVIKDMNITCKNGHNHNYDLTRKRNW